MRRRSDHILLEIGLSKVLYSLLNCRWLIPLCRDVSFIDYCAIIYLYTLPTIFSPDDESDTHMHGTHTARQHARLFKGTTIQR
mmetsp:Transcript_24221/g.53375  ORF Transcript_24221/g.53375 Transcript_24221/m.53375 type:complete len:83 (+) Transcript_24221:1086-1334(+)